MTKVTYEIVEHDGGWAYRVDGVFSEPYPTHDLARQAAERAAQEQLIPARISRMAASFRDQPYRFWYIDQQDSCRAGVLAWNTQRVKRQTPLFGSYSTAASSWSSTAPGSSPTPGCSPSGNWTTLSA